jgi:putative tryptophan/tyrosine transport system substrate-binding protein
MKRREFITALGSMAAAGALNCKALGQQQAMPVIGLLSSVPFETRRDQIAAFHRGLREAGYVEGQNIAIQYRSADNDFTRLPKLAAELVERKVSVIVTIGGDTTTRAAKSATTTIPVIFVSGNDAAKIGLVDSLNRPGGNVTGISFLGNLTMTKELELLSELVPSAGLIGVLVNSNNANIETDRAEAERAAGLLGKTVVVVEADADQLAESFTSFVREKVGGIIVAADPVFLASREQIVALAARHRLAAIYSFREFALIGGLMSYGSSISNAYREAGIYAGKILKGEKPADLPVMQATKFELVINLKVANALGVEFPAKLLSLADEVIE